MHSRPTSIITLIALAMMFLVHTGYAQVPQVRVSQAAQLSQTVGLADVNIRYHRPGVKGRTIWGELLPYGEIWRAGANEPTLITFSEDVSVSGTQLKAGTYRFVVIPMEKGPWTVIFNSEVKNWGTVYEEQYDVARIAVTPVAAPQEEWMSFSFDALSASSADLVLRWEKISLRLPLTFDTEGLFAAASNRAQADVWRTKNAYARYLLDYGTDIKKAGSVADEAVTLSRNLSTLRTKAEILAKMKKFSEAVQTMEEGLKLGKAENPNMNTGFYDGMIANWKKMK